MNKRRDTLIKLQGEALGLLAAIVVAVVLTFAVEYLTGVDSGTLGESAGPVHYTRTNAPRDASDHERRDRADRANESLLAALSIP
jgi:hypothetical protein